MHFYMSSYNYAEYIPTVLDILPLSHILPLSDKRGNQSGNKLPRMFESDTWTSDGAVSVLPCNTTLRIMPSEHYVPELSKRPSTIADLVCSDDKFLDQLEVMHYLSFSDF